MRRRPQKISGFTLLEVVAALAILGISLGYLLVIKEANVDTAIRSHESRIAKFLARSKMEEVILKGTQEVGTRGTYKDYENFKWSISAATISPLEGVTVKEVTVTIKYSDDFKEKFDLKVWLHVPQTLAPTPGGGNP